VTIRTWLSFLCRSMAPYSMSGFLVCATSAFQSCGAHATTSLRRPAASSYLRVPVQARRTRIPRQRHICLLREINFLVRAGGRICILVGELTTSLQVCR
jgi:hypothetical protein